MTTLDPSNDRIPYFAPLSQTERAVLIELCRPIATGTSSAPASNREIGDVFGVAISPLKRRMERLFERFGLSDLPSEEKRGRLVSIVLDQGILRPEDF